MSRGVNKVILIGSLGQDPEMRFTGEGRAICTLSVATNESWTDKQSGEKKERTEWHRCQIFGPLAEIAGDYLAKGRQVYLEGSLRTQKYTDKQGVERYSTGIICTVMQMLGRSEGGKGDSQQQRPAGGNRAQDRSTRLDQRQDREIPPFDDDEIPF